MAAAIPYVAMTIAGAAVGNMQQAPQMPNVPKPPPPQQAKMPDMTSLYAGMQGTGQAGGKPGNAQTWLTGPGGVDPNAMKLGKPTLLGE